MKTQKKKVLVVTGMHRSMTSLAARAFNLAGARIGDSARIHSPDAFNPAGYWEYTEIVDLHDEILAALDRRWDTSLALPDDWQRRSAVAEARKKLEAVVRRETREEGLWLFKDPRAALLLPMWRQILEGLDLDAHYVLCARDPLSVARSLHDRDGIALHHGCAIWLNYNLSALDATADCQRTIVRAEDWLDRPLHTAQEVMRVHECPPQNAKVETADDLVRSELVHWSEEDPQRTLEISPAAADLWDLLNHELGETSAAPDQSRIAELCRQHQLDSRRYDLDFERATKELESLQQHYAALQLEHSNHCLESDRHVGGLEEHLAISKEYVADLQIHLARRDEELRQAQQHIQQLTASTPEG